MKKLTIEIYTDGSCHTQLLIGGWAALIFFDDKKTTLKGSELLTTHNRMELLAVIEAINWVSKQELNPDLIVIYSDSQYVVNLISRKEKLTIKNFITNKGLPIQNRDLVQSFFKQTVNFPIEFIKVKAHQKPNGSINYNREVDLLVRKLVREKVITNG